jgi:hypothetical protein
MESLGSGTGQERNREGRTLIGYLLAIVGVTLLAGFA